jgi:hypothetical protein
MFCVFLSYAEIHFTDGFIYVSKASFSHSISHNLRRTIKLSLQYKNNLKLNGEDIDGMEDISSLLEFKHVRKFLDYILYLAYL